MTTVQMTNQKPFNFNNFKPQYPNPNLDTKQGIASQYQKLTQQLFQSFNQQPVQLTVNQQPMHQGQLTELLTSLTTDTDNHAADEEIASLVFHQASQYRAKTPQYWNNILSNSQLLAHKWPLPSSTLIYTYDTDIQNQAKVALTNPTSANLTELKLGMSGNLLNNPVNTRWVFVLSNPTDYQAFQTQLIKTLNKTNDPKLLQYLKNLQQIKMDQSNVTSWITGSQNQAHELNRYILDTLYQYQPTTVHDILPLSLKALFEPIGFAFINLESLTNSTQAKYNNELQSLQLVTNRLNHFKFYRIKQIKQANTIQANPKNNQKGYQKKKPNIMQLKQAGFHKTIPATKFQLNRMAYIVNQQISKNHSDNTFKQRRKTFMRPNRRHPDDLNLKGRVQHLNYRPDIHIYLDTSGSVDESQYKTGVNLLIQISQILNTNLYFTSFSHVIAQPVKLLTKNVPQKTIYQEIKAIPKVSGGTEYENVWQAIDQIDRTNQHNGQASQINFIITDFDYDVRDTWNPQIKQASTKNTYYLPLAADNNDYQRIKQYAMTFANELIDKNDVTIKKRLLL